MYLPRSAVIELKTSLLGPCLMKGLVVEVRIQQFLEITYLSFQNTLTVFALTMPSGQMELSFECMKTAINVREFGKKRARIVT